MTSSIHGPDVWCHNDLLFPLVFMYAWRWGRRVEKIVIICGAVNCLASDVMILHDMCIKATVYWGIEKFVHSLGTTWDICGAVLWYLCLLYFSFSEPRVSTPGIASIDTCDKESMTRRCRRSTHVQLCLIYFILMGLESCWMASRSFIILLHK